MAVVLKGGFFGLPNEGVLLPLLPESVCPGSGGYVGKTMLDVKPGIVRRFSDVASGLGSFLFPFVADARTSTSVESFPHAQE